jgi:Fe-S oxidoreductase
MPWTLKNVALDPAFAMQRRIATKMEMEPTLAGVRIRLRQQITINDEMYERNKVRIVRLVAQGVLTAVSSSPAKKPAPPETVAPEPTPAPEPAPAPAPAPAPLPESQSGEGITLSEASTDWPRLRVGVLTGCIQDTLYRRVNDATVLTLEVNGYEVVPVQAQGCCGALHAHEGDLEGARKLARANVQAFEDAGVDFIATNAAGCGAAMKEYGELLEGDETIGEAAHRVAERCRDVTELLADRGPLPGAPVNMRVAYDAPCHLLHAQGVSDAPLEVLAAIPGLEVHVVQGAEECCGGAGTYGITHPELGGRIGRDKLHAVMAEEPDEFVTGNPGCISSRISLMRRSCAALA